jgi:hypothetical protein
MEWYPTTINKYQLAVIKYPPEYSCTGVLRTPDTAYVCGVRRAEQFLFQVMIAYIYMHI